MATALQDLNNENQLPQFAVQSTEQTSASSSSKAKTSLDLEQNPFEQSFATKSSSNRSLSGGQTGITSPQLLTPGGRKLPPLVLSPNIPSGWSSSGFPRTGLTPNESSLRTGLTPGGNNFTGNMGNIAIHGINTPGSLSFPNFTPGLSSILGASTAKEFDQQLQQAQDNTVVPSASTQLPATGSESNEPPSDLQQPSDQVEASTTAIAPNTNDDASVTPDASTSKAEAGKRSRKKSNPNIGKAKENNEPRSKKIRLSEEVKPKPKKNGASRPQQEQQSVKNEDDDSGLTEEEKRKQFLERNRVAASKCRQRKKQQMVKMENDLNFYLNEYNNLTNTLDQLKEQSLILRAQIINNKVVNPDILQSLENILQIVNQTNYVSRMRGNNPSNIIPTVQPINPVLVQQNQQIAAMNAANAANAASAAAVRSVGGVPAPIIVNNGFGNPNVHRIQNEILPHPVGNSL